MTPRVLHILEGWSLGGTERYVERLCRYSSTNGAARNSVVLLNQPDVGAITGMRDYVHDIHVADGRRCRSLGTLRQLIRSRSFDLLHSHLYTSLLPVALLARSLRSMPHVATLHMPLTSWGMRHRAGWRLAVRLANHVVANSRAVAHSLGTFQHNVEIIPGCIDPAPLSRTEPSANSVFQIIGVGRLSREKSWSTLVKAIAKVPGGSGEKIHCRIIGAGDTERVKLAALADNLRISPQVDLPGALPFPQVAQELIAASLFVLPSQFEGLGLAPLEAMAAGVPTITSDFPAAREYIDHGTTGHRFPIGDSERLAKLIAWHRDHPQESAAMGQRGRTAVMEQFSEENTIARYADIYAGLMASRCQEACQ